jgi:sortase A
VTDRLGYLENETEELPHTEPRADDGSTEVDPHFPPVGTPERAEPDFVHEVLGPQRALRARPKPTVVQTLVGIARAQWAKVAHPQLIGVAVFGLGLLILLLVGYLYVFTPLSAARAQHTLLQEITANAAGANSLSETKIPADGKLVAVIDIRALHLYDAVVEGTSAGDLQSGPGHMHSTPLPGQPGNAVIAGRRATYGAPFGAIGSLTRGDVIQVVDGFGTFRYRVARIVTAQGGRHDVVTPTATNRLTLVTAGSGIYPRGRLAAIAYLIGKPSRFGKQPHFHVDPAELGLSGDPASGLLAIWWSILFLGILGGVVWLLRRWSQPVVVLLLAIPVLLLVGLFACESFIGFLPATL